MNIKALLAAGICATMMGGCAIVSDLGVTGLAESIEDNAATLNEAHTRAMTAIIAINVLRARDRWPTNYTTLSGIKSNPTLALNGSAALTPLGLGNASLPFAGSGASIARNETANAEYSVNPFANNDKTQSLLKPIGPETLLDYWNAGWPRETLTWMFVDSVKYAGEGRFIFVNGDDFVDHEASAALDAKRFVELVDAAKSGRLFFGPLPGESQDERACAPYDPAYLRTALGAGAQEPVNETIGVVEQLTGKKLILSADQRSSRPDSEAQLPSDALKRQLLLCDPSAERWGFMEVATGREVAEVRTRSFDDMIYFLGETLRVSESRAEGAVGDVVLFKTYRQRGDVRFAVRVQHAGEIYFIAPQAPSKVQGTADDQTGNVLGLLNQLYQFAQSDEFLRAPEARLN